MPLRVVDHRDATAPRGKPTAVVVNVRNTSMITGVPAASAAPLIKIPTWISM
jgi:hypothetical protein